MVWMVVRRLVIWVFRSWSAVIFAVHWSRQVSSWFNWPDSAVTSWLIMLVVSRLLPRPEKVMAGCVYWPVR